MRFPEGENVLNRVRLHLIQSAEAGPRRVTLTCGSRGRWGPSLIQLDWAGQRRAGLSGCQVGPGKEGAHLAPVFLLLVVP